MRLEQRRLWPWPRRSPRHARPRRAVPGRGGLGGAASVPVRRPTGALPKPPTRAWGASSGGERGDAEAAQPRRPQAVGVRTVNDLFARPVRMSARNVGAVIVAGGAVRGRFAVPVDRRQHAAAFAAGLARPCCRASTRAIRRPRSSATWIGCWCWSARTRTQSVSNGRRRTRPRSVLAHDAARPFVDAATIDRVIAGVERGRPRRGRAARVDTLKEVDDGARDTRSDRRAAVARADAAGAFRAA